MNCIILFNNQLLELFTQKLTNDPIIAEGNKIKQHEKLHCRDSNLENGQLAIYSPLWYTCMYYNHDCLFCLFSS